jgi:hypothetical protein
MTGETVVNIGFRDLSMPSTTRDFIIDASPITRGLILENIYAPQSNLTVTGAGTDVRQERNVLLANYANP